MKLLKLKINNFKGISQFILEPNGENCRVYGANGAGKTTLADAYFWLLFGKDSNGNTNFNVKTNGTTGLEVFEIISSISLLALIVATVKLVLSREAEEE